MPILKIAALVLPLSLDTFAVSAALGVAGLGPGRRLRLSLLMAVFEAGMPLAGYLAGGLLGRAIGNFAEYAAAALLVAVGLLMIKERGEPERDWGAQTGALAMVGLGLSVSLDELGIGFVMGLLLLPAPLLFALIGAQALVASQLGLLLGMRVGRVLGGAAEQAAGWLLVALGAALLVLILSGHAGGL